MDLLDSVIKEKRTDEQFVLLEGLMTNSKLTDDDDKLEHRLMDEFLEIERNIGTIAAVIGLQFHYEPEVLSPEDQITEDAVEGEPAFKKETVDVDGEPKEVNVINLKGHTWTLSNKKSLTLP